MDIEFKAAEYRSAAEIIEAARQIRRRVTGMISRDRAATPGIALDLERLPGWDVGDDEDDCEWPPKPLPAWQVMDLHFDQHVIDTRCQWRKGGQPIQWYLKERCAELGLDFQTVVKGISRKRNIVRPRQVLMWEVKRQWPETSLPEIGRIFGGRDHTTILHGIRRVDMERGTDVLSGGKPNAVKAKREREMNGNV